MLFGTSHVKIHPNFRPVELQTHTRTPIPPPPPPHTQHALLIHNTLHTQHALLTHNTLHKHTQHNTLHTHTWKHTTHTRSFSLKKIVTMVTRNSQIWYLARKTLGSTDLHLGMHIQLHSGSNMSWVPLGHTSSLPCVRLKMPKVVFQQTHLNLWIAAGACECRLVYVCNCINCTQRLSPNATKYFVGDFGVARIIAFFSS